jgi:hypothetical protein
MTPYTIVKYRNDTLNNSPAQTADSRGRALIQYVLSLLPVLACPVGMGLLMAKRISKCPEG